jgi:hypothetical protein
VILCSIHPLFEIIRHQGATRLTTQGCRGAGIRGPGKALNSSGESLQQQEALFEISPRAIKNSIVIIFIPNKDQSSHLVMNGDSYASRGLSTPSASSLEYLDEI